MWFLKCVWLCLDNMEYGTSIEKLKTLPGNFIEYSDLKQCEYRVLQGSFMRPVLFLIYINDFCEYLHASKIIVFADDSRIISSNKKVNR